jgi:hypothetical protein
MRRLLRFVYILVVVVALLTAEYGLYGAVYFLTYEKRDDYSMIRSVVLVYVCVGAIFNAYILSVAMIMFCSTFERLRIIVWCLEESVKLFHAFLGFNADRTVDHFDQSVDLSEEYLKTIGKNSPALKVS